MGALNWNLDPFVPLFRNPHLATIAGNFWSRRLDEKGFPVETRYFETEPGVQVLVHSQKPTGPPVADLVLVHGLEGSSNAGYARSLAQAALERGYAVHRFHMRSCGSTEHLCGSTLYHSGQTCDVLAVIRQIRARPIFLIGFSLGGNVSLKLAGELGEKGSQLLTGVVAVSTPIDLAACSRALCRRENILYARRFLDRLKKRVRLKEGLNPGTFNLNDLERVKTIYDFDDVFTARSFGFGTADNYYATQSSWQFLDRIAVPALVIQAKDDPMIPFQVYDQPAFSQNPNLTLLAVEHGGHLGFISKKKPRFWLDRVILEWIEGRMRPVSPELTAEHTAF